MVAQLEAFPAPYAVEEADVARDPAARYEFRTDGVSSLAPRFELDVTPANGAPWRGAFFGGRDELDLFAHSPSKDDLIAVAGGVAYTVTVSAPGSYEVVPLRPVRAVEISEPAGVAILVGFTSALAIGGTGRVEWRSDRLVSDGFTEVRLTVDSVVLRGYDAPTEADLEITLNLADGEIRDRR